MSTATCCTATVGSSPGAEDRRSECGFTPAVDIVERPDELVIVADLPGANRESIRVELEDGTLTMRAQVDQRSGDGSSYLRQEYGVGDYGRTFHVGDGIDEDRISAEYADGVLTLHLLKRESVRTRRIEVRSA